jgi:serine phosphatase RsbU (regulator of sigma subunit)
MANAGCIAPIIRRMNGLVEWIDIGGLPLGMGVGAQKGYAEAEVNLEPGDIIILTSDGVVEATNLANEMFGFERLKEVVAAGPTSSAQAMLDHLKAAISAFIKEAEPHDDMTIVIVQV